MDAFENIVAMILNREGYWVRTSYKVNLTKEEKRKIGKPSSPRWELDVVAYKPRSNELLVIECKSFLNSRGVVYKDFSGKKGNKKYKLFNDENLWSVVRSRLIHQLKKEGACLNSPKVQLCLAAGKIPPKDQDNIQSYCKERGWQLFDADWFKTKFGELVDSGYENEVAVVAAKLMGK
ncbi:MAG: hypothetical protein KAV00_09745 [Phycisphaerae bacterium]|nr:hypothetical protein [Phycisphaerae bacterium]